MLILSTKLKNALKKRADELSMELEFNLKNIIINGEKRGCSGFVKNLNNGSIVYVTTEEPCLSTLHYMYRHADSFQDYRGYRNRWADTLPALVQGVFECLAKTPQEHGDRRI